MDFRETQGQCVFDSYDMNPDEKRSGLWFGTVLGSWEGLWFRAVVLDLFRFRIRDIGGQLNTVQKCIL